VAAVLGGVSFGASAAQSASDTSASGAGLDTLAEITVTAQRREQSIQDVPISMQAFTAETLQELNITTFDDYIKDLPNVSSASNGPGQNEVFMRGLSAGSQASQGSASTGLWPNVAIYLDNQSGQLPNRNLDVYAADLNRIEVLEGPQGTLFGAGAEAGVIRYITNEPKLNTTEGSVKGGYSVTSHGDPNTDVTAVINIPIIEDHMAVRGVIYNDRHGGYIDNVAGTFTRKDSDVGIGAAYYSVPGNVCPDGGAPNNGYCVPPGAKSINNSALVQNAINPATYEGMRVEALYKFNEDWDALITQSYQSLDTRGVFYQQPNASDGAPLQPLQVTLFNPSYDKDRFESTAWTVNGRLGMLKAVYTGGYLVRNVDQTGDYTNYTRGVYADYYQCYGDPTNNAASGCASPSAYWHTSERNTHQQHEVRLSTPDEWQARGILGAFYEDNTLYDQTGWHYRTLPNCTPTDTTNCFSPISAYPGSTVQNAGLQPSDTSFYQDTKRETRQIAFFLSADYDLIPKVLTATLGTRHFLFLNSYKGSVLSSFGCKDVYVAGGCRVDGDSFNLDADHLSDSEAGWKSRANLTWHITRDAMVYYTFSQGFRPGGFNQNVGAQHILGPDGNNQYAIPRSYSSDKLTNNELGWKTEWFEHRLIFNGAIYQENWDDVQISFFQPNLVGNLFYDTNGQNFRVRGLETSLIAKPLTGLTLQAAASWNQSVQTNSPALIDNVLVDAITGQRSVNYGKAITQNCTSGTCVTVTNPFGPIGSPSADSPPLQYNGRIRYDWNMGGYAPFIQFGATHQGHSYTQAGSNPNVGTGTINTSRLRFENPPYSTFDASIGVSKDNWYFNLYGENLANSNASTFVSTDQFIVAQTPLRPRILGGQFGLKF
jgi:outer membrane receptor protein involved in Fe transport